MSKLNPWVIAYERFSDQYTEEQINEMTFAEIQELLSYE